MLARYLRLIYLFQLLSGALLGSYFAVQSAQQGSRSLALLWLPLCTLLLPVLLQFLVIAVSMVQSRTQGPWGSWWQAFGGEFKAALLVFVLRQPWPHSANNVLQPLRSTVPIGPSQATAALPVLLVHGYVCNHRVWDDMAHALRQAGHPVLSLDLEPLFVSIDDYAPKIESAVADLLNQTGAEQVVLVGHSMGGLVIRAWLRTYSATRQAQVARIITLGTPHQGTRIARTSPTPNGAQMLWHSDWINALARSEDPAKRALMQIAITPQDNVVFPQRDQVLVGSQVTEFNGLGHLELCLDAGVINWVCQQVHTDARKPC